MIDEKRKLFFSFLCDTYIACFARTALLATIARLANLRGL